MWRQQHVVGHHAYTNLDGVDPDIRTTETDVRSVTPHHGWHPYHVRSSCAIRCLGFHLQTDSKHRQYSQRHDHCSVCIHAHTQAMSVCERFSNVCKVCFE